MRPLPTSATFARLDFFFVAFAEKEEKLFVVRLVHRSKSTSLSWSQDEILRSGLKLRAKRCVISIVLFAYV